MVVHFKKSRKNPLEKALLLMMHYASKRLGALYFNVSICIAAVLHGRCGEVFVSYIVLMLYSTLENPNIAVLHRLLT